MNTHIQSIYKSRMVTGISGAAIPLHSEIDPAEGEFIHQIIAEDTNISKTLEVGCAFGLSSLHICDALKSRASAQHTIVDPFQYSQWDGVGIMGLKQAGIDFFTLIEKKSEFALPELLDLGSAQFDFVFIDGWHTFDHTLLDCFYATRLLKTGGYLVVDDLHMPAVARVTAYLSLYPCYEIHAELKAPRSFSLKRYIKQLLLGLLPSSIKKSVFHPTFLRDVFDQNSTRMLALKKVADDGRNWDWFSSEF